MDQLVGLIESRDADLVFEAMHSETREHELDPDQISEILDFLPDEELNFEIFYAENRIGVDAYQGVPIYLAGYEAPKSEGYIQLTVAVAPENDVCCVGTYIRFTQAPVRPSTYNDLTLEGKGWLHYLIAIIAMLVPLFILVTVILCAFDRRVGRKWAWVPFISLGLWGASFNWTTGALGLNFLNLSEAGFYIAFIKFNLLGVSVITSGPFQPWIIQIGTPVGALLYWLWPKLMRKPNPIPEIETLD